MSGQHMVVARDTDPNTLGSAITHAVQEGRPVTIRALGAGPVNQAVKAAAIACSMLADNGQPGIVLRPEFRNVPGKRPGEGTLSVMFLHVFQEEP